MWFLLGLVVLLAVLGLWISRRADPVERDTEQVSDGLWLDQIEAQLALAKRLFQAPEQPDYARAYQILEQLAHQHELPEAYVYLAFMHQQGLGRAADVEKAIHLLEAAHQRNSDEASYYLGEIYRAQNNPEQAVYWYQYGVARGHRDAQCRLAEHCALGLGVARDPAKAKSIWMDAAKKGHAEAQYRLGLHFSQGDLWEHDPILAKQYLHQAAEQQHAEALALLTTQQQSQGTSDLALQLRHIKQQAFRGDAQARSDYCWAVLKGQIDAEQQEKILALLQQQADQHDVTSLRLLGLAFAQGLGVDVNQRQAFQYWTRAAALHDVVALCGLAQLHLDGGLMQAESDPDQAFKLYQQAYALDGNALTQFMLGKCYLYGYGTAQQPQQALVYIQAAAAQQFGLALHNKADISYALGRFYADPFNPFQHADTAQQYLHMAAEQGSVAAARELGECYLLGHLGLKQDDVQARTYFAQAAAEQDIVAQRQLAILQLFGRGGEKNATEALTHLLPAVEAQDGCAIAYLAQCYEHGWGVDEDIARALDLYQQAIDLGEPEGYYHMGRLYAQGHGVARHLTVALDWLKQAQHLGHPQAAQLLHSLQQEYPLEDEKTEA